MVFNIQRMTDSCILLQHALKQREREGGGHIPSYVPHNHLSN
jgi:hypothetical protein